MTKHIAAGAAFAVLASAGIAAAQSSPALGVNLYASPRIERGAQDTLLALITLSAKDSSAAIQVPSVRLDTSFANGATVSDISDCRVRNVNNFSNALNNGGNAVGIISGSTVIPFDVSFTIATGTSATLAFTCDVSGTAQLGGTIAMSLVPSSQAATAQGSTSTVTISAGRTTSNAVGPTSGVATVVADATPTTPTPTVPGVPNTGSETTQNLILLAFAGLVALGGILLARKIAASG